jgi:hypothetical protein
MSLATGRYQLTNAFRSLKLQWEATENAWRDVVRKEFADEFWDPLTARQAAVLIAVDRLDQALTQMKRDCE